MCAINLWYNLLIMAAENAGESERNFFADEEALAALAEELGSTYEPGTPGPKDQPIREWSSSRVDAHIGFVRRRLRELGDLPILPTPEEQAIHTTPKEIVAMTDAESTQWLIGSLRFLIENPKATIDNLIDED